jgi:hypothetical protein
MIINKNKIKTQEDLNEPAPMDQVEGLVEGKMKKLTGQAKQAVADGLQDPKLAREAEQLKREGDRKIRKAKDE